MLIFSLEESKRFKNRVFRGEMNKIDETIIIRDLINNSVDIAIIRVPVESIHNLYRLENLNIPYLVADTLVYYDVVLSDYPINPIVNKDIEFIECTEKNVAELRILVSEIFQKYHNHYFSNPYLNRNVILEGYIEWANNYIRTIKKDRFVYLVKKQNNFVAFLTCSISFEKNEGEGVLYGVLSSESGNKIYSDMIRFTQSYMKNLGIKRMIVSTQVHNYAVQKVWMREGFRMYSACNTIHINAFLSCTNFPKKTILFKPSIDSKCVIDFHHKNLDIKNSWSSSHNFIHNEIEEYLDKNIQHKGFRIISSQTSIIKNIQYDNQYKLIISIPIFNIERKKIIILIKYVNLNDEIFALEYLNIVFN